MVRSFLIAWHFLLGVPIHADAARPAREELAGSMAWFPLIGLILGGILAVTDAVLTGVLARAVIDALLIVLQVALTRGLHQDGLADCLDGLAGGNTKEQRLAIMRDPRIGAIGATGLILALGLRYAALSALPAGARLPALLCMPAVGRWSMVLAASWAPYGRRDGGLGRAFHEHLTLWEVGIATLIVGSAGAWLLGATVAAVLLAGAAVLAAGWALFGTRTFGGMTGDTLGALNELIEVLFLLMVPVLVR